MNSFMNPNEEASEVAVSAFEFCSLSERSFGSFWNNANCELTVVESACLRIRLPNSLQSIYRRSTPSGGPFGACAAHRVC